MIEGSTLKPIIVWESLDSVVDLPGLPSGEAVPRILLDERPSDGAWPGTEARAAAKRIIDEDLALKKRHVLLVGQGVAIAFGLASRSEGRAPVLLWWKTSLRGVDATVCVLPEPSRDPRWYREAENVGLIQRFLDGFFRRQEQVVLFGEAGS